MHDFYKILNNFYNLFFFPILGCSQNVDYKEILNGHKQEIKVLLSKHLFIFLATY
jgi:hypothetical protein